MTDILEQLFYGEYKADRGPSAAQRKLMEEGEALWEQVYKAAGDEMGDRLWKNQCAMSLTESLGCFKEGFYLGTMLMLELFYTPQQ